VTAVASLRLVEQGKLDLDADINDSLGDWKLPSTPGVVPDHVSARQLLSHGAGLTVHGFPGYAEGAALPTLTQILDGQPPANSPPVRMELNPGKQFRYSGGGYLVLQEALAHITGKPFAAWMDDEVLAPLGMRHSTFALPLPATLARDVASAHVSARVLEGRYHRYPESAAAGLWTTAGDLARLLIDVQAAAAGKDGQRLSPQMAKQMLEPAQPGWGLGFALGGSAAARRFGHDGSNEGFESTMTAYVGAGEGIVVLTNAGGGKRLADEIVRAVAHEYGWPEIAPREVVAIDVPAENLEALAGYYETPGLIVWIERAGEQLTARVGGVDAEPLLALSPTRFIASERDTVIEFGENPVGGAKGFQIVSGGPPVFLERKTPPESKIGDTHVFLRGSMNEWSTEDELVRVDDDRLRIEKLLSPGAYEFKLASADWRTIDLGASGMQTRVEAGKVVTLQTGGGNLTFAVDVAGSYRFELDALGRTLIVSLVGDAAP
jgi:CubicO group peptidase (beta-lactamase class C family)